MHLATYEVALVRQNLRRRSDRVDKDPSGSLVVVLSGARVHPTEGCTISRSLITGGEEFSAGSVGRDKLKITRVVRYTSVRRVER